MKVHFITFGCKVNQYETECLKELFLKHKHEVAVDRDDADIFIINSCTVTSSSDSKVMGCLKGLRKRHPESTIILTGCYPQAFPESAEKIAEADIITGSKNKMELLKLAQEHALKRERILKIDAYKNSDCFQNTPITGDKGRTRAFLKIQDGCNQFCSYCIIPYARGRIRSKPLEDVVCEVNSLAHNGYKEIVLVGINLAFYGVDLGLSLADAVLECSKISGIERIRLGSLEPEMLTDQLLMKLSQSDKLCPHFHLSLQSGCEKTLKSMNRKYTPKQYSHLADNIRMRFSDAAFTTDVMVGFPGESDEDFNESVKFVKSIEFSKVHVFPYSIRPGTPAADFDNHIPHDEKIRRAKIMTETAQTAAEKFLKFQIGKSYPVLFEKESSPDFHQGHTPNYTFVKVPAKNPEKSLRNMIFYVKINKYADGCCFGDFV